MSSKKKRQREDEIHKFAGNENIQGFSKELCKNQVHLQEISSILKNEQCPSSAIPFKAGEQAINLDSYEIERAKHARCERKPTVDFVLGLEGCWLLMVEIKYGVHTNKMNTVAKKIREIKEYSFGILNRSSKYRCESKLVILLKDDNFQRLKSYLLNCLSKDVKSYKIMKVSEFYDEYFVG